MQQQKRKIRSRYVKLGLTIFLAGAGLLMCYYLLYNTADVKGVFSKINGILTPFYLGIIMAYLLCPIYNGTLRIVYRRSRGRLGSYTKDYRLARVIATIVSFAVLMVVLIGFFMLVIPELTRSIVGACQRCSHLCGERHKLDREDGSRKSGSCQSPGGTTRERLAVFPRMGTE